VLGEFEHFKRPSTLARHNLSKVSGTVVDLTGGIPGLPSKSMLSRWAIKMEEVVIQGHIPGEAITTVR